MIIGIFLKRFWNCWIYSRHEDNKCVRSSEFKLKVEKMATNLLEVITEFNDRRSTEKSILIDYELAVFKGVDVALDEE